MSTWHTLIDMITKTKSSRKDQEHIIISSHVLFTQPRVNIEVTISMSSFNNRATLSVEPCKTPNIQLRRLKSHTPLEKSLLY